MKSFLARDQLKLQRVTSKAFENHKSFRRTKTYDYSCFLVVELQISKQILQSHINYIVLVLVFHIEISSTSNDLFHHFRLIINPVIA